MNVGWVSVLLGKVLVISRCFIEKGRDEKAERLSLKSIIQHGHKGFCCYHDLGRPGPL